MFVITLAVCNSCLSLIFRNQILVTNGGEGMVMFKKTARKQTIIQFIGGGASFVCLFFSAFSAQAKGTLVQGISDQKVCEQSNSQVVDPQALHVERIRQAFMALSDRCAENETYDQVLACLTDLFEMVKKELKSDRSSKIISTNSTAAKSMFFQLANLLAKDTRRNSMAELKKVYLLVAPVFIWGPGIKNKLFIHYRNEHYWRIVKDWTDGPVKVLATIGGAIFLCAKLINLPKTLYGKAEEKRQLGEMKKEIESFREIINTIDGSKKKDNVDTLIVVPPQALASN